MKRKKLIPLGIGVCLLALGGIAMAERGSGCHGGGGHFMKMLGGLDLTEDQDLKLVRISRGLREEKKKLRQEMKPSMNLAIAELTKEALDQSVLHGIANERIERFSKLIHKTIDEFSALHETLTPEQRQTLVKHAEKMKEKRSRFHER